MMKSSLYLVILVLIFSACRTGSVPDIDSLPSSTITEVKRISLSQEMDIESIDKTGEYYVVLDSRNHHYALVTMTEDGLVTDRYDRKGKGPGEFGPGDIFTIGCDGNTVYLGDRGVNKIMRFEITSQGEIRFQDEFTLGEGSIIAAALGGDGRIYCSIIEGPAFLHVYDKEGTLLGRFVPAEHPDFSSMTKQELMDYAARSIFIPLVSRDGVLLFGFLGKRLLFTRWEKSALSVIREEDYPELKGEWFEGESRQGDEDNELSLRFSPRGTVAFFTRQDDYWVLIGSAEARDKAVLLSYNSRGDLVATARYRFPEGTTSSVLLYCAPDDTLIYQESPLDEEDRNLSEIVVCAFQ